MAVVLTEPYRTNWQHVPLSLAEGEVVPGGELANYLLATGAPVKEVDPVKDVDDRTSDDGVPGGSTAEVLAWVGDDPGKAAQALAVEQGRSRPRSRLMETLQTLAAPPAGPVADAGSPPGPDGPQPQDPADGADGGAPPEHPVDVVDNL